jgi:hypothetical protein
MAAKKRDTWDVFREKMKDKRCKKGQPALFSIQQTDLTSLSEDERGVKWLCY